MKGNNQQPNFTRGNDSFDMEFMMPPDVMSIDSDISKLIFLF